MDREIRVLVVDSLNLMREGLRRILAAEADMQVVGLSGEWAEALGLAARFVPDVVILDADLHGVEETVRRLTAGPPGMGVLILAATGDVQQALHLLEAGATGYVCKNAPSQDLVTAVRHVSRGEIILEPGIARDVMRYIAHRDSRIIRGAWGEGEPYEVLTEREMEVLHLLCEGYTDKEIGQKLYLSVRTIGHHLGHIYAKLGVHSRTEAMRLAVEKGWVTLGLVLPVLAEYLTIS